jgi:hypothetical protein
VASQYPENNLLIGIDRPDIEVNDSDDEVSAPASKKKKASGPQGALTDFFDKKPSAPVARKASASKPAPAKKAASKAKRNDSDDDDDFDVDLDDAPAVVPARASARPARAPPKKAYIDLSDED